MAWGKDEERIMAGREPGTGEAGALVERVARAEQGQISEEEGVCQFCSGLGSQCSWNSGLD